MIIYLILLLFIGQFYAHNVPVSYEKIMAKKINAKNSSMSPREIFLMRQQQILDVCKLIPVKLNNSNDVEFGTAMTTVEEVCACSEAALLFAKSFASMNKKDQQKYDYSKDKLLEYVDDVIFNKTNIPHDKIFNHLYKKNLISQEQFDHGMKIIQDQK